MTVIAFANNKKELEKIIHYINEHHIVDYTLEKNDIHPDKLKKVDCVIVANPTSFHNANVRMNLILLEHLFNNEGRFVCIEPSFEIRLKEPLTFQFASQFFIWYDYFNTFFNLNDSFIGE